VDRYSPWYAANYRTKADERHFDLCSDSNIVVVNLCELPVAILSSEIPVGLISRQRLSIVCLFRNFMSRIFFAPPPLQHCVVTSVSRTFHLRISLPVIPFSHFPRLHFGAVVCFPVVSCLALSAVEGVKAKSVQLANASVRPPAAIANSCRRKYNAGA